MRCWNCGADAGFNYTVERRGDSKPALGAKNQYMLGLIPTDDICTVECRLCFHKTTVREWVEELEDEIDDEEKIA